MKLRSSFLALLLSTGCPDEEQPIPDAGRPDATPGGDSGLGDASGEDASVPDATADPGALVGVSISSTIGVLLDELPIEARARIASEVAARPTEWWTDRAKLQLRMMTYRLIYREAFYDEVEMKRALPLPPESVWRIELAGTPSRQTIDGHDLVAVEYTMESVLLSDLASPGISDPALGEVGGSWDEEYVLPIDPTLLLQRTGYACIDEDQFPPESVDAENAYEFFDDTCEVETEDERACHYSDLPNETCVDALARVIGRVETAIHFERLEWDATLADEVRLGEVTTPDAPDLAVVTEGFQSLSNHRIVYKYIPPDHCSVIERCVGGPGWRRLLQFDSIDHNIGGKPLHIGPVDYFVEGLGGELIEHNVYELSDCHNHYHFRHYGDFSYGTAMDVQKNGFCIESTGRASNNELSPLFTEYTCHNQGVDPGWVDLYAAGLTCNWIDVSELDTSGGAIFEPLTFHSNPDGFICEGALMVDANGDQIWEPTAFTTESGDPVDRPACEEAPGTEANDIGSVNVTLPVRGGMMSTACADDQVLGPLRNCGFTAQSTTPTCVPTATVALSCTGGSSTAPMLVRICETSIALSTGVDCSFQDSLADLMVTATATATFRCPQARDATEVGGSYAVYTAPLLPIDGSSPVTCAP